MYFVARCSGRFESFRTWKGNVFSSTNATFTGNDVGVDLVFPKSDQPTIELKVAISFVSIQNARANLEAETRGLNFDQVFAKAKEEWDKKLLENPRRRAEPKNSGRSFAPRFIIRCRCRRPFKTSMESIWDSIGKFIKPSGFTYFTDMSLWDTFRTVHPLFNSDRAP